MLILQEAFCYRTEQKTVRFVYRISIFSSQQNERFILLSSFSYDEYILVPPLIKAHNLGQKVVHPDGPLFYHE